ncbi:raf homolog serine/threonine-protein kinase Raf isoform X2 [Folsomia candida]|uniref:raf homolog serine/threonine-protein kinase Raf isoform X2 n=1 Tax=Folsomia candida TaxID=158441 RepID=UPI000B8FDCCD|nr:raf homolog serine/threonine-protein kinase Raf isoform X2 [Folsomia candida]XP_035714269.1 raf homolog serine/threonine-protein kinase Raf isoform X2 [Folsomia candida]XP_035714270.1 raf homolog serine/threonine-protein kinase Raf isoform X2 [Folsomia candida]
MECVMQLRNIQNVIRLTKENIDALNDRFAGFQDPPSMYLQEYSELTTKLHDLEKKEQDLREQMGVGGGGGGNESTNHPAPIGPTTSFSNRNNEQDNNFIAQSLQSGGEEGLSPRSPFKSVIRAYLPNQQRTSVQIRPGQTVRDALSKAMKLRKLTPEMCAVYRISNPAVQIPWESDISKLEGDEVKVEILDKFPIATSISHNFVRKTFFSLAYCECCRRLLFQGFQCRTCGYRFHQRCAATVPALCESSRMERTYYEILLAQSTDTSYFDHARETSPPNLAEQYVDKDPPPLGHRERSTSAPNVCYNLVGHSAEISDDLLHRLGKGTYTTLHEWFPFVNGRTKSVRPPSIGYVSRVKHGTFSLAMPLSNLAMNVVFGPRGPYTSFAGTGTAHRATSPASSPTKVSLSHSAQASPTNTLRPCRPRARSADETKVKTTREFVEDWEIPADEILIGHRIGSGSFGTVFKGIWHGPVAVKTLNVKDPTPAQLQAFKNEVAVLRKTRHVNILLFMGCVSKPQLAIVTQWCEGSSLYKHIHVTETKFPLLTLIEIARQTAQGMDYLHAKNIIHRDMKSNNIFLHDDLTVKIGDFGLATVKTKWSGSHQQQQPTGSILWMAPEVIRMQDSNPYTFQSDVYAFGIVLFELLSGQLPYSSINNRDQILFMVGRGFLRPDLTQMRPDTPNALKRLLEDCIKFIRDERPLFRQILTSLENLLNSLPKIHRSESEPMLNRTQLQSEEFGYICSVNSPKTPINTQFGNFPSFSSGANI